MGGEMILHVNTGPVSTLLDGSPPHELQYYPKVQYVLPLSVYQVHQSRVLGIEDQVMSEHWVPREVK